MFWSANLDLHLNVRMCKPRFALHLNASTFPERDFKNDIEIRQRKIALLRANRLGC